MESFAQRANDFLVLGWFYKSGKKNTMIDTGLKKRFFFFANGCLHYQVGEDSVKTRGSIDVEDINYYICKVKSDMMGKDTQLLPPTEGSGIIFIGNGRVWTLCCTNSKQLQLVEGLLAQRGPRSLMILKGGQLNRKVNLVYSINRYGYLVSSACGMKKFLLLCKSQDNVLTLMKCIALSENITQVENSLGLVKGEESAQFWVMAPAIENIDSKLHIFTVGNGKAEDWVNAANWLPGTNLGRATSANAKETPYLHTGNSDNLKELRKEKMRQRHRKHQRGKEKNRRRSMNQSKSTSSHERRNSLPEALKRENNKGSVQQPPESHRGAVSSTNLSKERKMRLKRQSTSGRSLFDVKKALARRMSSKGKELFHNAVDKVRERKRIEDDENKSRLAFSDLLAERVDFWQTSRDRPEEQLTLYELLSTVDVHFPEIFPQPLISAIDNIMLQNADESDENVKRLLRKYNKKALLRVHPDRQRNTKIETKLLCEIICQVLQDIWSENA